MDKMKEKVFCIGHNKTGTTSIGKMLSDFGYNVAPQRPFEDFYIKDLALKNKPSLFDLIEKYDAFQDIPFSKSDYYLKIYEKYPNSKYILTIRDSKEWFASLIRFHKKLRIPIYKKDSFLKLNKDKNFNNYLIFLSQKEKIKDKGMLNWELLYDENHYISLYEKRNQEIIDFFTQKSNLITIDISKEKDDFKIRDFLDLKEKTPKKIPHLNRTK
ncbi:hypothetical protein N9W84_00425 [bacterium]|nr:hypothetical protein [bacterium]